MQLRLPRPKDAEPRRKRPPIVSTADPCPCGICQQQISRYTCPNCNLPYCSLACFRSPEHSACTDSFAQKSLKDDLNAEQENGGDEKKKMLELLRQFEEQQKELEEIQQAGPEDEETGPEAETRRKERKELEGRIAGLDLDALPPEQLLSFLTPEQQAAFEATLQDPNRVNKLVEEEFEGDEPWWVVEQEAKLLKEMLEASRNAEGSKTVVPGGEEDETDAEQVRPAPVPADKLPVLKVGPDGKAIANPNLFFNVVAVLFGYAFTLRTFSLASFRSLPGRSPERTMAIQVLVQLLPFIVERSTSTFADMYEAIESVAAGEPQGMSSALLALLLHDVAHLLRPAPIAAISSSTPSPLASHALAPALSAISDLHHLFCTAIATPQPSNGSQGPTSGPTVSKALIARPSTSAPLSKRERQRCMLASAKLLFYASFLFSTGNEVVQAAGVLAVMAEREAKKREAEEGERKKAVERRKEDFAKRKEEGQGQVKTDEEEVRPEGPKIVELA
ncbi:zinc finger, HIT-type protein [Rhodotorula toruloides]|uniref:Zinc finger, HIT-type protein n=1 Tax=Rhodotorula toruloides TaxID=5286 RepID=A0A511KEI6_RHOTO|nr:zinc finger, HIT-type protein [Rhodotorula toruloides]